MLDCLPFVLTSDGVTEFFIPAIITTLNQEAITVGLLHFLTINMLYKRDIRKSISISMPRKGTLGNEDNRKLILSLTGRRGGN